MDKYNLYDPEYCRWFFDEYIDLETDTWMKRPSITGKANVGDRVGSDRPSRTQLQHMGVIFSYHRCKWIYYNGPIPDGLVLDHIDRNPHNNNIDNLRLATQSQNCHNHAGGGTNTGFKNVRFYPCLTNGRNARGSYEAYIMHDGVNYRKKFSGARLGIPDQVALQMAVDWVATKRIELHGKFACHGQIIHKN